MKRITRTELINICDNFLNDKIEKLDIINFAARVFFDDEDEYECEDETVDTIIFQWDNEIINFEINKKNVELWKKWLIENKNELEEHNNWNIHIEKQKEICEKYNSKWKPINKKLNILVSKNLNPEIIQGLRKQNEKRMSGWIIYSNEVRENNYNLECIPAEKLLTIQPKIIKYLGLETGFKFWTDNNGNERIEKVSEC